MAHYIFTPAHDMLRQEVRRFVERELAPHAREWEEAEAFPDSVFRRLGELGYLGLRMPEAYGGQGLDYAAAVVLAEELSRAGSGGVGMAVAVHAEMVMPPLLKFGTEEQKQHWLPPMARGEEIGALAITEPGAGSDVAGIRTRAVPDGDGWIINGTKMFITNGVRADRVLVVTRTDPGDRHGGVTLFVVDRGTPGFSVAQKLKKLGMHSSDTAELVFDNVRVSDANRVGPANQGFYEIMWELQGERLVGMAGAIAGAERCLETALEYARQREAFGRPIAKFQVIRHKLAQMATEVYAARCMLYDIVYRWQQGEYPVKEISMLKLFGGPAVFRVADEALQIHGGYGYMAEYDISRAWRDLRLIRIGAGTDEIMAEIIGRLLVDE